jgi:hypothetical protein
MGYDPTSHKTLYMGCVWGCRDIPQEGRRRIKRGEKKNKERSERMKKGERVKSATEINGYGIEKTQTITTLK